MKRIFFDLFILFIGLMLLTCLNPEIPKDDTEDQTIEIDNQFKSLLVNQTIELIDKSQGDIELSFTSNNEDIITVDKETGRLHTNKVGNATITIIKKSTNSNDYVSLSFKIEIEVVEYRNLPVIYINTEDNQPILSKNNWISGSFSIMNNGKLVSSADLKIKGRGNTTWDMPKKPYSLKLEEKTEILGMKKHKRWALLANYSDKSLLRNEFVLDLGKTVFDNLSWTPAIRSVELLINGEYLGVYQIVEKIDVDERRVDINTDNGEFLVEVNTRLDEQYNFITEQGVSISFVDPEEVTSEEYERIKSRIQEIENIIYSDSFTDIETGYVSCLDVNSFVDWYIVNELTKNNDAIFHQSVYMYYADNKLYMGPLWDFDISSGNINFNGCDNPEGYWVRNAKWISRLFADPEFESKVKKRWNEKKAIVLQKIEDIKSRSTELSLAANSNFLRWDILNTYVWPNRVVTGSYEAEVDELIAWLKHRYEWMYIYLAE